MSASEGGERQNDEALHDGHFLRIETRKETKKEFLGRGEFGINRADKVRTWSSFMLVDVFSSSIVQYRSFGEMNSQSKRREKIRNKGKPKI